MLRTANNEAYTLYSTKDEYFEYYVLKVRGAFSISHEDVKQMNGKHLSIDAVISNKWHNYIEIGEYRKGRNYIRSISITKKQTELLITELQERVKSMEYHQQDLINL